MTDTPRTDAIHLGEQGAAGLLQDYYTLCRQLERELAGVKAEYANSIAAWTGINEEKERAEAALEEARRDAERYRWIVGRRLIDEHFPEFEALWFNTNTPEELDAAIDSKMEGK